MSFLFTNLILSYFLGLPLYGLIILYINENLSENLIWIYILTTSLFILCIIFSYLLENGVLIVFFFLVNFVVTICGTILFIINIEIYSLWLCFLIFIIIHIIIYAIFSILCFGICINFIQIDPKCFGYGGGCSFPTSGYNKYGFRISLCCRPVEERLDADIDIYRQFNINDVINVNINTNVGPGVIVGGNTSEKLLV